MNTRSIDVYQTFTVTINASGVRVQLPSSLRTHPDAKVMKGLQVVPGEGATMALVNTTEFSSPFTVGGEVLFERNFPLRLMASGNEVEPNKRFFRLNGCCGIDICDQQTINGEVVNNGTVNSPYTLIFIIHYETQTNSPCSPRC